MKFIYGLSLLIILALASTSYAQEIIKEPSKEAAKEPIKAPKSKFKAIVKADEELKSEIKTFIQTKWTGAIKKTKKSKVKAVDGKKNKKGLRVVYSKRKASKKGKVWKRISIKKGKKTYAKIRVQRKCPTKESITPELVKKAMINSLDSGKSYKVNCAGKIYLTKKKSKKAKKVKLVATE